MVQLQKSLYDARAKTERLEMCGHTLILIPVNVHIYYDNKSMILPALISKCELSPNSMMMR